MLLSVALFSLYLHAAIAARAAIAAIAAIFPRHAGAGYGGGNFLAFYRKIVGVLHAAFPFVGYGWIIFKRRISLHLYFDKVGTSSIERNNQYLIAGKGGFSRLISLKVYVFIPNGELARR